jgi:hypothetical protein
VLFNDSGVAAGDAGFTFAKATGRVFTAASAATAPTYSFVGTTHGFYRDSTNNFPGIAVSGGQVQFWHAQGTALAANGVYGWTATTPPGSSAIDVAMGRASAGVIEVNTGTAGTLARIIGGSAGFGTGIGSSTVAGAVQARVAADRNVVIFDNATISTASIGVYNDAANAFTTLAFAPSGSVVPGADNSTTLGYANPYRWASVWAATGTIQTSDAQLKTDVVDSDLGLAFIDTLRPVSYKWIVGGNIATPTTREDGTVTVEVTPVPGVRTHYGLIAQDVKAALDAAGVVDFGGYIVDDLGKADSYCSLRYDEFLAPMIAAIKELSARVKELEAKLP